MGHIDRRRRLLALRCRRRAPAVARSHGRLPRAPKLFMAQPLGLGSRRIRGRVANETSRFLPARRTPRQSERAKIRNHAKVFGMRDPDPVSLLGSRAGRKRDKLERLKFERPKPDRDHARSFTSGRLVAGDGEILDPRARCARASARSRARTSRKPHLHFESPRRETQADEARDRERPLSALWTSSSRNGTTAALTQNSSASNGRLGTHFN